MRHLLQLIQNGTVLALLLLLCQNVAAAGLDLSQFQSVELNNNRFYYQPPVGEAQLRELSLQADMARRRVQQLSGDTMLYPVEVVLAPDHASFLELVGPSAENSLAVALLGKRMVIINRLYQNKWPDVSFQDLLVHEWMHVYLDVRFPGKVPRWLHEGLAQMAAGETVDRASLAWARLAGGLIPLSEMGNSMPGGKDRTRFAYVQSLAVTEHLVRERHSGRLRNFLEYLRTPSGESFLASLDNPAFADSILASWKEEQKIWMSFVVIISSGTTIWIGAIVLLFIGYFVIRRRRRQRYLEDDEPEEYIEGWDDPAVEFDQMAEEHADDWKN